MKSISAKCTTAIIFGAALVLAIFITGQAFSQATDRNESHKKMVIKIISDDNGTTTIIDTTMVVNDSTMIDSIKQEIDKVIELGKGNKHCRFKVQKMPEGFNYKFEMPCPPECPRDIEELEGMDWESIQHGQDMEEYMCDRIARGIDLRDVRSGKHGQTLNDLLGEIPMDRVVSYSIKDRKNGKRIIIDLNDAPMFENQERIVVIGNPGKKKSPK